MTDPAGHWPEELLDRMQYAADPLADATVAHIVGAWSDSAPGATLEALRAAQQTPWQRLAVATRLLTAMQADDGGATPADPRPLAERIPEQPDAPGVTEALRAFVAEGSRLPEWMDPAKIGRAEQLFIDDGALSCVLLFCASLPECYVIPDLSMVLAASGQLATRTDYRIRMTAAMIFPVMMKGGLGPQGPGVAQVLKVRLIHATIRSLILRDSPQHAVEALGAARNVEGAGVVPPHPALVASSGMTETMFGHGWKLGEDGLPCNQEELAYTLLTFSYVFLRSLRRLGVAFAPADEEAYLHCWNVAGYVLGIEPELMAHTMDDAAALFDRMQVRGRADPVASDPRPGLGEALVATMADAIPFAIAKPFPRLMVRYLCGGETARDLGLAGPVDVVASRLFFVVILVARVIDTIARRFDPDFSIARFVTRVVGYHFMTRLLMDETRPLTLPRHLAEKVNTVMAAWSEDPKSPRWVNRLENKLTTEGKWQGPVVPSPHSD